MILRKLVDGVDERLDGTSFLKRNLRKVFPDHWSFLLGEVTLYCFVLLVLTGIFLTFFYVASPEATTYVGPYAPLQGQTVSQAYASVLRISFEVRAGLVMRQIHHWAALVFMCVARRAPRARLLHGGVPQASRAELDRGGRRCC